MQFPESWLREFCNPPLTTAAAGRHAHHGRPRGRGAARRSRRRSRKVVVGEIKEAVQHPNADRLRVCQVDVGQGALAEHRLRRAERARRHQGAAARWSAPSCRRARTASRSRSSSASCAASRARACCARRASCKLSDDHGGLLELAADAPLGAGRARGAEARRHAVHAQAHAQPGACAERLRRRARAVGADRRAAERSRRSRRSRPRIDDEAAGARSRRPTCAAASPAASCAASNTKATTPQWMVDRLARCGQRSVTRAGRHLELRDVRVRPARRTSSTSTRSTAASTCAGAGRARQLKLLNGNTVTVDEKVGVIADDARGRVAGRHHGRRRHGGVRRHDATSTSRPRSGGPRPCQGRSRRFNFSTDAGHRFERGVDPSRTVEHIERITQLILDICGGEAGPMDDQVAAAARAQAGDAARGARRQGHRHAGDAGAVRRRAARASACRRAKARARITVTPPPLPLRPRRSRKT